MTMHQGEQVDVREYLAQFHEEQTQRRDARALLIADKLADFVYIDLFESEPESVEEARNRQAMAASLADYRVLRRRSAGGS